jgi:hypothetical protein
VDVSLGGCRGVELGWVGGFGAVDAGVAGEGGIAGVGVGVGVIVILLVGVGAVVMRSMIMGGMILSMAMSMIVTVRMSMSMIVAVMCVAESEEANHVDHKSESADNEKFFHPPDLFLLHDAFHRFPYKLHTD